MVIRSGQILSILDQKRQAFTDFDGHLSRHRQLYQEAMADLVHWSSLQMAEQLSGFAYPGALATKEWDIEKQWRIPFTQQWSSHEDSLSWVSETIRQIPTFAVDGSQLYLDKDISLPIALVQIGWYENFHCPEGIYHKDIRVDVLTPQDLGGNSGEPRTQIINMRRSAMELQRLVEYTEDHSQENRCLAFYDGALVATFAEPFEPRMQEVYVQSVLQLLRASERHRVPVIGYIDTTYTRDLTQMLKHLQDLPDSPVIHDAQLLDSLLKWGDRTPFFTCCRSGTQQGHASILSQYQEMSNRIGFVYLKTHEGYPVRLEIPVWIFEQGLLDWVLNLVRCEVIIGKGYPYVLETADQTALLRAEDRNGFMRLLQDWSDRERLPLRLSRKMVSKLQRRRVR